MKTFGEWVPVSETTSTARTADERAAVPDCRHDYIRVYTKSRRKGTRLQLYCKRCGQVMDASWREVRR